MNKTDIEWTTFSANPLKYRQKSDGKVVWACIKKSAGCAHCYSETIAIRFDRGRLFNAANMEELEPFLDDAEMHKMRTAKVIGGAAVSGSRCFLADMTDLFGEWVSDDLLNRLFSEVLEHRTDVTWQLLTKREERMRTYLSWRWGEGRIPAHNIHVGVSVENQQFADSRIPELLQTPAAIRFLSVEPLLGPVHLGKLSCDISKWRCGHNRVAFVGDYFPERFPNPNPDNPDDPGWATCCGECGCEEITPLLHWVIVGGESGPKSRPCRVQWIRSIVKQCQIAQVPCFVKQLGSNIIDRNDSFGGWEPWMWPEDLDSDRVEKHIHGFREDYQGADVRVRLIDRKGGNPEEWCPDIRVREFPS